MEAAGVFGGAEGEGAAGMEVAGAVGGLLGNSLKAGETGDEGPHDLRR